MGFFDRNRKALIAKGIDPARLPPGQYSTDRFPALHVGEVPAYRDLSTWSLRIFGAVDREVSAGLGRAPRAAGRSTSPSTSTA